jgi:Phasin protein
MAELMVDSTGEEPDTFAHNGWSVAAQRALAKGLPITISHDGRQLRVYPDGRVEEIDPKARETSAQTAARVEMGKLDVSRFELADVKSRFELPDVRVPPAFREIAEKIAALANQGRKIVDTITEAANLTEDPAWLRENAAADPARDRPTPPPTDPSDPADDLASAASGAAEYHLKMVAAACANARTMLEFTSALMNVKTFADMVQISSAYARRQIEAGTDQAKTLAAAAEKMAQKPSSEVA